MTDREQMELAMKVEAITRTVYRSHRTRRCYMTLRAACNAEARAILKAKYPSEKAEFDNVGCTYPGFTWQSLPRSDVLFRRLVRLIRASVASSKSMQ